MGALISNILRWVFSWIDRIVILVMNLLYNILMDIASLNIVSTDVVEAFSSRIGLILGIFMLFNLAINFLNYLVSPEKFSDKSKGGAKLILNIIVSLILLVTYNWIFNTAYKIQGTIINKQIIPEIVFGVVPDDLHKTEIAYYVYSSMMTINPDADTEGVCKDVYYKGISDECEDFLTTNLPDDLQFITAVEKKDASKLMSEYNVTAKTNEVFVFDYLFIFSTVIGVIVVLILAGFLLDIAKRSVKLYFYQIIAPVPIVANMVPGKGEETFKKWYKSCFSTYLDLFIRLFGLFFAIFVIATLYSALADVIAEHYIMGIVILLGALMFAKELPQLVQDLTGIKLDGSFAINPIKKMNQVPVIGKGFGALGGAIAGARAGGRVGNALGGAFSGALMGASSVPLGGSKNGDPILTTTTNSVYKKMTGNDFINFSFSKMPLRIGAEKRIKEVKDARNVATEQLNDYNSQLNTSQQVTASLAQGLASRGIDVNNLDSARESLARTRSSNNTYMSRNKTKYDNATSRLSEIENERQTAENARSKKSAELNESKEKAEKILRNIREKEEERSRTTDRFKINNLTREIARLNADYTSSMSEQTAIESDISAYETKLHDLNTEASTLQTQVSEYEDIRRSQASVEQSLTDIARYENNVSEQNTLRQRISKVQKDIDDLNNEKRQRERFYDYDPSPQADIQDAFRDTTSGNIKGRQVTASEMYKDRIENPNHKDDIKK